ncbi:hypothetical protein F444_07278 [Phytophthora nicotianae P1976]|uniref:MULE transposase domain-containing protein n=1 Tax=Phytophthora nicotianae P1976 TaxID=1317066 RepID=A0A081AF75_PHYNI|nr:hypothetical protein F444_07278 [Phytophthora nicotianae P1976]
MVDADEAQLNGVEEVFASSIGGAKPVGLRCYFHVLAKVHEKTRALEPLLDALVMRDIADLHFTATAGAYSEKKAKLLSDWKTPGSRPLLLLPEAVARQQVSLLASVPHSTRLSHG